MLAFFPSALQEFGEDSEQIVIESILESDCIAFLGLTFLTKKTWGVRLIELANFSESQSRTSLTDVETNSPRVSQSRVHIAGSVIQSSVLSMIISSGS